MIFVRAITKNKTHGHKAYLAAVGCTFGPDVDYAMQVKRYDQSAAGPETRYSPTECIGAQKEWLEGIPNIKRNSN